MLTDIVDLFAIDCDTDAWTPALERELVPTTVGKSCIVRGIDVPVEREIMTSLRSVGGLVPKQLEFIPRRRRSRRSRPTVRLGPEADSTVGFRVDTHFEAHLKVGEGLVEA